MSHSPHASFLSGPYLALLDNVRAKRHGLDAESLRRFRRLDAILSPYLIIIVVILTSLSRRDRTAFLTHKVGVGWWSKHATQAGSTEAARACRRCGQMRAHAAGCRPGFGMLEAGKDTDRLIAWPLIGRPPCSTGTGPELLGVTGSCGG